MVPFDSESNINLYKSRIAHLCDSSHGFRGINGSFFYLEIKGQGYELQHLQWFKSMANINLYKNRNIIHFSLAFTFLISLDFENVGHENDIQHSQWRHSTANTRLPI